MGGNLRDAILGRSSVGGNLRDAILGRTSVGGFLWSVSVGPRSGSGPGSGPGLESGPVAVQTRLVQISMWKRRYSGNEV